MDIEQLKLILETVRGVSGDAQIVAVCWILIDKLLPAICWMAVFGVLVWKFPHFVKLFCGSDKFMIWARDQLGTGSSGYLADHERERTEDRLRELVIASKQKG